MWSFEFYSGKNIVYKTERLYDRPKWWKSGNAYWVLCKINNPVQISHFRLKYKWYEFKDAVIIQYHNNVYTFEKIKKPSVHYKILINDTVFLIVAHKGYNLSIYKNNIQIGEIHENSTSTESNFELRVILDNDVDLETICIILSSYIILNPVVSEGVTINLGRAGSELRKYDSRWIPKS